jgi:hypothetical protein
VAGIAFGAALPHDVADVDKVTELPELEGEVLSFGVWFFFGAALARTGRLCCSWGGSGRGMASVVFLLSVIVHGVSAGPLGNRFARGHREDASGDRGPQARRQAHR